MTDRSIRDEGIPTMTPRPLPPVLVLGTSGLGSGDEDAALETALSLLRSGLLIDTSHNYSGGASERTLGVALATLAPNERSSAAARILTKVDRDPETGRFDADRVLRSAEESLGRLGVDAVPLLHLHDPYVVTVRDALAPGGAVSGLVRLREEGVAASIGIAAGPAPLVQRYVDSGLFDAVLCHNRYTLVDRSAAPLFEDARRRGMRVFNAAPFGGDLLARGPRPGARYHYRSASDELRGWTAGAEAVCLRHGVSLPAVALTISLHADVVDATVVGVSSPARLEALLGLADTTIPEAVWAELDALGPAPSPIDDSRYGDDA
ncbi:aldo/keto reductase [Microbacterium sp. SA39]|uniref:aldo/keto reductase n=1 Tax=Microbacterium sp. SA39 TaxID=1263625 RepID=UPI00061FA18B|nr:aldo/keto reductase [Microbacterium sp. SA39]KJQ53431.1 D-threo-aldose 1-dehydrogenase [Microbacterium sp. SA39]